MHLVFYKSAVKVQQIFDICKDFFYFWSKKAQNDPKKRKNPCHAGDRDETAPTISKAAKRGSSFLI